MRDRKQLEPGRRRVSASPFTSGATYDFRFRLVVSVYIIEAT